VFVTYSNHRGNARQSPRQQLPAAAAHDFILCSPKPGESRGTAWEQRTLPGLVRQAQASVLFSPGYTAPIFSPVPVVAAIHDVSFAAFPHWFGWKEGLRRRTLTRLTARRACKVLTISEKKEFIEDVRRALYCSKMVSYAQGYMLLRAIEKEQNWELNMGGIALMWRGGCIIRSVFLGNIKAAFDKNPKLQNLLLDDFFSSALNKYGWSWRKAVIHAIEIGVPTPAFSTALAFFDGYRTERLPANLLQAQRDFFGAHTYERVDKPRGEFFHTNWTGRGGRVSSTTYNA